MRVGYIAGDVAKFAAVFAGLGAVIGIISGAANEFSRVNLKKNMLLKLPDAVKTVPDIGDNIAILADAKHANMEMLDKVARRCDALIVLYGQVQDADPQSVKPGVSSSAAEIEASIMKYLSKFYYLSRIPVGEHIHKHMKQDIPINQEMKYAHETIMLVIESLTHDIQMAVKSKLELGF
jgi:hypothetical protein